MWVILPSSSVPGAASLLTALLPHQLHGSVSPALVSGLAPILPLCNPLGMFWESDFFFKLRTKRRKLHHVKKFSCYFLFPPGVPRVLSGAQTSPKEHWGRGRGERYEQILQSPGTCGQVQGSRRKEGKVWHGLQKEEDRPGQVPWSHTQHWNPCPGLAPWLWACKAGCEALHRGVSLSIKLQETVHEPPGAHILTSSSSSFTSAFALLAGILKQVQKPLKDSVFPSILPGPPPD